jgi:D-alanyl-D-alanine carboxypeptidase
MRHHFIRLSILVCLCFPGLACQPTQPDLEQQLQAMLDDVVQTNDAVRSVALHVDAPRLGLNWEGAAGMADPENGRAMTPLTPVRIASNTKTFIAAAVLRLQEEGRLDINDSIADHLPEEYVTMLESDGYDTGGIALRELLNHTSGLFDHTSGDHYTAAFVADPMHRWTRMEQVRGAVEWGDPHGEPGEYYSYCDTGYVLLGAVVEQAAGQPMAQAVRRLLQFDRLGLVSTWWETLEAEPDWVPDRAHQFYGDVDTFTFDPSFDLYGGGGLVSTVGDLARFYRALFEGRLFEDLSTRQIMLMPVYDALPLPNASERALPPGAYRMGIWEVRVAGYETYRHSGFFGTLATYVQDLDLIVTAATNQNQDGGARNDLARDAILLVAEASSR